MKVTATTVQRARASMSGSYRSRGNTDDGRPCLPGLDTGLSGAGKEGWGEEVGRGGEGGVRGRGEEEGYGLGAEGKAGRGVGEGRGCGVGWRGWGGEKA